jgi:hypothetical protein
MLPSRFRFIWHSGFRSEEKIVLKSTNQKQELPMAAMFLMDWNEMSILYRGPSKDASYHISIHLTKWLQKRRFFRNQPIRNKNCLWWPCL